LIVDAHLHCFSRREGFDPKILVESRVIERAWVLSINGIIHGQATDEEVLSLAKKYKGFFVPFAYLDLERNPSIIDDFHEQGFAGLKAILPSKPYDDSSYFPFYERAEANRMPILFHVGTPWPYDPEYTLDIRRTFSKNFCAITLEPIANVFPKLVIIGAHLGGWKYEYAEAIQIARVHPNIYFDISAGPEIFLESWREDIHPHCGRHPFNSAITDKLLFGSDARYDKAVELALFYKYYFKYSLGDEEAGKKVLGLNAEKIISDSGWDPESMFRK